MRAIQLLGATTPFPEAQQKTMKHSASQAADSHHAHAAKNSILCPRDRSRSNSERNATNEAAPHLYENNSANTFASTHQDRGVSRVPRSCFLFGQQPHTPFAAVVSDAEEAATAEDSASEQGRDRHRHVCSPVGTPSPNYSPEEDALTDGRRLSAVSSERSSDGSSSGRTRNGEGDGRDADALVFGPVNVNERDAEEEEEGDGEELAAEELPSSATTIRGTAASTLLSVASRTRAFLQGAVHGEGAKAELACPLSSTTAASTSPNSQGLSESSVSATTCTFNGENSASFSFNLATGNAATSANATSGNASTAFHASPVMQSIREALASYKDQPDAHPFLDMQRQREAAATARHLRHVDYCCAMARATALQPQDQHIASKMLCHEAHRLQTLRAIAFNRRIAALKAAAAASCHASAASACAQQRAEEEEEAAAFWHGLAEEEEEVPSSTETRVLAPTPIGLTPSSSHTDVADVIDDDDDDDDASSALTLGQSSSSAASRSGTSVQSSGTACGPSARAAATSAPPLPPPKDLKRIRKQWQRVRGFVESDLETEGFPFIQRRLSCMCMFNSQSDDRPYCDNEEYREARQQRQLQLFMQLDQQEMAGGNPFFVE